MRNLVVYVVDEGVIINILIFSKILRAEVDNCYEIQNPWVVCFEYTHTECLKGYICTHVKIQALDKPRYFRRSASFM